MADVADKVVGQDTKTYTLKYTAEHPMLNIEPDHSQSCRVASDACLQNISGLLLP